MQPFLDLRGYPLSRAHYLGYFILPDILTFYFCRLFYFKQSEKALIIKMHLREKIPGETSKNENVTLNY